MTFMSKDLKIVKIIIITYKLSAVIASDINRIITQMIWREKNRIILNTNCNKDDWLIACL